MIKATLAKRHAALERCDVGHLRAAEVLSASSEIATAMQTVRYLRCRLQPSHIYKFFIKCAWKMLIIIDIIRLMVKNSYSRVGLPRALCTIRPKIQSCWSPSVLPKIGVEISAIKC